MAAQISPLFQAVEDEARRYPNNHKLVFEGAKLCRLAKKNEAEIQAFRLHRAMQRQHDQRKNSTGLTPIAGEFHWLEWEAAKLLHPDLKTPRASLKKIAFRAFMKKPYAEEYRPASFEKTRF